MPDLGQLQVAVRCSKCGAHQYGVIEGENSQRCGDCGRFAPVADEYCTKHDLDYSDLYGEDNHCPYCRREHSIAAQRMEITTRRPPRSVDDPAPAGSYDAW